MLLDPPGSPGPTVVTHWTPPLTPLTTLHPQSLQLALHHPRPISESRLRMLATFLFQAHLPGLLSSFVSLLHQSARNFVGHKCSLLL